MAATGISGLDVIEESPQRGLMRSPRPNFTIPPGSPPTPSYPVATQPYQPNFTMPGTGARQPFDLEAQQPSRMRQSVRSAGDAVVRGLEKVPAPVRQAVGGAARVGMRVLPAVAAGAALEGSMQPDATARYAKRFGVSEPTGDGSVGDMLKFGALRAGGFASDLGNTLTGGLAGKFYADMQPGAMPPTVEAPAAAPSAPNAPFAPNAQGQPGGTVPGTGVPMPPNPAGNIRKVGNSYEGENIKFGADINGAQGRSGVTVLPSMRGGFGPSSSPLIAGEIGNNYYAPSTPDSFDTLGDMRRSGGGSLRSNQGTLGGPRAAVPGELPTLPPGGFGGGGGGAAGFNSTYHADIERKNRETSFRSALRDIQNSNMKPRDKRAAMALAQELYMGTLRMENEQSNARMREGGDMARANLNAQVQREGYSVQRENNAAQRDVTMRGQDIAREGHMISAQGQRMRMQYDMGKDLRDFEAARADKALEQRSARESQLQKNLEAANTVMDSDGKPQVDARAVTEMRRGIDRAVARMGIAGPHELGPQAEQQLIAASTLLRTMQQNAGYLPWNPDKLKTIDPYDLTGLKVLPNGDRQITRPGQALGQIIPGRFFRTEEGARFFGGTPTNRYDILGAN